LTFSSDDYPDDELINEAEEPEKQDDNNDKDSKLKKALDYVMSKYKFATFRETDEILYYKFGVYHRGGEVAIRQAVETKFKEDASIDLRREVLDHIRCLTYHSRDEFDSDVNIINMQNGLYHILEDKLEPHRPDHLSLNQKPLSFDLKAVSKRFIRFVNEVVYTSDVVTLIDLMAYSFYRDNPIEVIAYLHGFGGNGKSVLFNLLTALHGEDNVSHVSMRTILERPFGLFELVDKDINLDSELSSNTLHDTAIIKKITGRERVFVEGKHKAGFHTKLHAKPWFSCNKLPQIADPTNADHRRNFYIEFPNTFDDNPELINELKDELPGIFNIMMKSLRRVLGNKKITMDEKTLAERVAKYERLMYPVAAFLKEASTEDNDDEPLTEADQVTKPALQACYEHFCKKYKLAIMSQTKFGVVMKELGYPDGRETTDKRERFWKGIRLNAEYFLITQQGRQTQLVS
jgi:P4 family phage/plasmid primase-like protien